MTYALKSRPKQAAGTSWRHILRIHDACELLPPMSNNELRDLGEDIKRRRLQSPIVILDGEDGVERLLDGRSRLDAMEAVGLAVVTDGELNQDLVETRHVAGNIDAVGFVLSANVHRRHLTREQKNELIEKVLKVRPEQSDRTIARQVKVSDKTVGKVRGGMERRSEIPHVEKRTDSKGRAQPARKPGAKTAAAKLPRPCSEAAIAAGLERAAPTIARLAREELEEHFESILDLCGSETDWPDVTAARRARRTKAMKKLRAVRDKLLELAKPAPKRGRPAKGAKS